MRKIIYTLFTFIGLANFDAAAQTWNIPTSVPSPSSSFVGTTTGNAVLKSQSSTVTTDENSISINTEGNAGVGIVPPLNPTVAPFYYEPKFRVHGVAGNHNIPAFNPIEQFKITSLTSGYTNSYLSLGLMNSTSLATFVKSSGDLNLLTSQVIVGWPSGNGKITIGSSGTVIDGGSTATSTIKGLLVIAGGNLIPSAPTGYGLYVGKGILAEKIKIASRTSTNWADFVFDKNYKLRPLSEVESFINQNHHLPEIPSTEEVNKNGVDLLEMDAKLLQKVEELTLYMIDMQKKDAAIQKENELLKEQIQLMNKRLQELETKK